jgi:hypothetical protein
MQLGSSAAGKEALLLEPLLRALLLLGLKWGGGAGSAAVGAAAGAEELAAAAAAVGGMGRVVRLAPAAWKRQVAELTGCTQVLAAGGGAGSFEQR